MTNEIETICLPVLDIERVLERGKLVGLAIVKMMLRGIAITLQGIENRRVTGDRITVSLRDLRHRRTGWMCSAVILLRDLCNTIGSDVAQAYSTSSTYSIAD